MISKVYINSRERSSIFNSPLWLHTHRIVKSYMLPFASNFSFHHPHQEYAVFLGVQPPAGLLQRNLFQCRFLKSVCQQCANSVLFGFLSSVSSKNFSELKLRSQKRYFFLLKGFFNVQKGFNQFKKGWFFFDKIFFLLERLHLGCWFL